MKADERTKEDLANHGLMLSALQELAQKITATNGRQSMADSKPRVRGSPWPETTLFGSGLEDHFKRNCQNAKVGNLDPAPVSAPDRKNRSVTTTN